MNERHTTRSLAELLADQTGLNRKRAEDFINALANYFTQGLERNKVVKIFGFGVFKILLVRERESVHIQTGERFIIPTHHKITFTPDKDFKEQINRPFALFEPIEATESEILLLKPQKTAVPDYNTFPDTKPITKPNDIEAMGLEDEIPASTPLVEENRVDGDYFNPDLLKDESGFYKEEIYLDDDVISTELEPEPEPEALLEVEYNEEQLPSDSFPEGETYIPQALDEEVTYEPQTVSDYFATYEEETETDSLYDKIAYNEEPVADSLYDDIVYEEELVAGSLYEESDTVVASSPVFLNEDDANKHSIKPDQEETINNDNQLNSSENKKKRSLFWTFAAVIAILLSISLGSGIGVYYFLQRNSDKTLQVNQNEDNSNVVSMTTDEGSSLLIGTDSDTGDEQSDLTSSPESTDNAMAGSESNETSVSQTNVNADTTNSLRRQDENSGDWLAPSQGNIRTESRRVNQPNREIDERNKALASNSRQPSNATTTQSTTNTNRATTTPTTPSTPTSAKSLPARVKMTPGSSLTQIAAEYYGDKIFWVYIYEHNKSRIKNFDNIPVGTEIQLPAPNSYGIDAKNNASLQKARQKQAQLTK